MLIKTIALSVWEPCGNCGGKGFVELVPGIIVTCPQCHGAKGSDR